MTTYMLRIKIESSYVCSRACDWLTVTPSESSGKCGLFGKDITIVPTTDRLAMRCTQCTRVTPPPSEEDEELMVIP